MARNPWIPAFNLKEYEVSEVTGFLLPNPCRFFADPKLQPLDSLACDLPDLIQAGAEKLRKTLDDFPMIYVPRLAKADNRRAMMIYHFAMSAYCKSKPEINRIPQNLAIPSYTLARRIGKPPILSYMSYVLDNWRLIDPEKPFELSNLDTLIDFSDIPDDKGFKLVHIIIEKHAGAGLAAIGRAQHQILYDDALSIEAYLWRLAASLTAMYSEMVKMPACCSPDVYYRDVRPWIQMFKDVVYENVWFYGNAPRTFRGETGAQSTIMPAFDAGLGIEHQQTQLTMYLDDMRNYMPPRHSAFIDAIKNGPSIRQYVDVRSRAHPMLVDAYNTCIDGLVRFRKKHFEYAIGYIFAKGEGPHGTGGTPFQEWLDGIIKETEACYLRAA